MSLSSDEFTIDSRRIAGPWAFIIFLFVSCCPSTIGRFIISVIIVTFNGVFRRWSSAHIGKKVDIAVTPFLTYFDAASSIIFPRNVKWICASLDHLRPNAIFCRMWFRLTVFYAMFCFACQATYSFLHDSKWVPE